MKQMNLQNPGRKLLCYIGGLFLVTIGINLSKISALGITPVSAIPRACEQIMGVTLGVATVLIYIILIVLQLVILRRKFGIRNVLGLPLTFLFSFMVDLTGSDPDAFGHLLVNFPQPEIYIFKLILVFISTGIAGFGVFLYLRPQWVSMPSEGLAQAISTVTGKFMGDCKTITDTTLVVCAVVLQIIFLGGLRSFIGDGVVVREGTIIAAVGVGQVVKFLGKRIGPAVDGWLNKEKTGRTAEVQRHKENYTKPDTSSAKL